MLFSQAWFALMRRNALYRKRHWISTLLEMVLPLAFVGILIAIKNSLGDAVESELIKPTFPNPIKGVYRPLSFLDYVTTLKAPRICTEAQKLGVTKLHDSVRRPLSFLDYVTILEPPRTLTEEQKLGVTELDELFVTHDFDISGMPFQAYDWQNPFVKCDNRFCTELGQDAQDFCEYYILAIAPKSSSSAAQARAQDFYDYLLAEYPVLFDSSKLPFDYDFVRIFDSETQLEAYVSSNSYGQKGHPKVAMAVVWENSAKNNEYAYVLRQNSTGFNVPTSARPGALTTPDTARILDDFIPNDRSCPRFDGAPFMGPRQSSCTGQYLYNGIITIQKLVGDFILKDSGANVQVADHGVRFVPFPTKEYEDGGFFADIAVFVPLLITLGLLFPVSQMISYICREKELRQKELLKMMGVQESDIGWSWFGSYAIVYWIVATLCALVSTQLYTNSTRFIIWLFWIFTFTALVVFSMVLASLSAKTTRTVLIGLLLVFMGVFLTLAVDYEEGSAGTISMLSLHPITAFSYGLLELGRLEDTGVGVTSDTIDSTPNPSGYTFASALRSLIFDSIFFGIISWYLNRVITPDFGQALPWYFPFTAQYWGCHKKTTTDNPTAHALEQTDEDINGSLIPIEGVSDNLRAQSDSNIVIRHLSKKFGGDKTAVDNLNLTMYNGQVTALLGHNGAGKTTTISMLTGALAPSSGTAKLLGNDLLNNLNAVRDNLGICLQHDCLFPAMTVREHIQFFSRLKGLYSQMSYAEAEEHIDQIIRDVALYEKRNTFSKNLSGGMKRKLSVAMAFCGGSKVVLLDEPTSGMDPFSRRFTWNVIRQYRQGRCILLTTHFMDEADVLGDRIAIMAEGQLRCVGSPFFLKKHYGVGYQLTIEKDHDFTGKASAKEMEELDGKLMATVKDNVKEAALLNNVGSELSFQLPVGEAANFLPMFEGLDENPHVASYGVSITTMDEVFLLVARGVNVYGQMVKLKSARTMMPTSFKDADTGSVGSSSTVSTGSQMNLDQDNLFFTHVRALLGKRAANFRRDKKAWLCTTILPSLFVLAGLLIFTYAAQDRTLGPLVLKLEDYNKGVKSQPKNPITVNNVNDVFHCQPGVCSYAAGNFPFVDVENGSIYALCGAQGLVNAAVDSKSFVEGKFKLDPAGFQSCTIDQITTFMDTITEAGVELVEVNANTVEDTSQAIFDSVNSYKASQYAAVFYTHDDSSILSDGSLFNETVLANCTGAFTLAESFGQSLQNDINDCPRYTGLGYIIQYNFTAYHVAPTYMSVATEGIARSALGDDDFTIKSTIHPLPLTAFEEKAIEVEDAFTAWFLLVLSFPFIAGSFGTFIVTERESKAKHLQTVTGVTPAGYWVSTFLWDVANYQLPLWIVIGMFFIFDVKAFITTKYDVVGGVIIAMILFGPAAAGFTYCLSYLFKSPALCNVVIIISGFMIGMGGPLTVIILLSSGSDPFDPKPNLIDISKILSWVLRFNPCFCLGRSLYYALNIDFLTFVYPDLDTVWSEDVLLWDVVFLAWESVVYLLLAIQIDKWSTNPSIVSTWKGVIDALTCQFTKKMERDIITALEEDSDVLAEEERIASGGANNDLIVVDKLTKLYDNGKKAVNGLSLGIPPGQVFGLLGVNGAGKTTMMQMLTAEFPATTGDATLAGYSVSKQPEKTRRRVGYCPQFDAHFANMTGREHVELYATIKGIPMSLVKEAAAGKLAEVGLSPEDSDRLAANYSGGMKRRLSLATATIGDPQIVFLDECSTGVDPVARREIWGLISNMVAGRNLAPEDRTSVILTTHSMEECEALCPRIGIMANGRLRALGSAQHLKNKFGKGYQIEMKCKLVSRNDPDYKEVLGKLAQGVVQSVPASATEGETAVVPSEIDDVFFRLDQALAKLQDLTGDTYLSGVVHEKDPIGYNIYKSATSLTGVPLDELAAFATVELRVRKIAEFIVKLYSTKKKCFERQVSKVRYEANSGEFNVRSPNLLRERQDTKVRYEVNSEGIKISSIFANLEENKDRLLLDDYGVSQTSLEQVFNMHAAQAEELKHETNDGFIE